MGKIGIVHQGIEQGVHRGNHRHAVFGDFFDQGRNVARIGNQNVVRTDFGEDHQVHGEAKNVIQRQSGEDGFAFTRELGLNPRACLLHVGDDVAMGQNRAFGHACGAARVLQEGHVF